MNGPVTDPTGDGRWLQSLTPIGAESREPERQPRVFNHSGMTPATAARAYNRVLAGRALDSAGQNISAAQFVNDKGPTQPGVNPDWKPPTDKKPPEQPGVTMPAPPRPDATPQQTPAPTPAPRLPAQQNPTPVQTGPASTQPAPTEPPAQPPASTAPGADGPTATTPATQLPKSFQQNPVFAELYDFGHTEGMEAQSTGTTSPQIPPSISPQDRVAIEQSAVGQLLFAAPSAVSVPQLPPTQQELDTSRVNQILPEGVSPPVRGGPAVVWVDGNNTQGSLFIDEFGVRHWDYVLANGVSIKVEQGGGSDGADRPWTNTKITQPGASVPVVDTYATQGVTSYIDTVDGRDVNVVLFQGGDIGLQTQDVDGGTQTTQITPSGPYSTHTSAAGTTWQSNFGSRLFARFSGTDGSESEESGPIDRRGAGEGYFTYPNGIRKNYTTVDGVITNGHYVDREGIDLGRFTQVNGITTFTPSQVYIDRYIREQGVADMRVVYDPTNGSAQTYYRLVNLAEEQQRDLESGDIPGIEWATPIPQRSEGIIEHYKGAFTAIGDELSNYWTGPLIATMNARAGSNGISFPSYETPAEKEHTAGEVFWAAVAVIDLATLFLPIPIPRARWLAGVRNGGKTSPSAVLGPTTAPLPGGRSFTDTHEPSIIPAPSVIPAPGPNPVTIPGNRPLTIDVRSFPDNRRGLMMFRSDDDVLIHMPKVKPMPQVFDVGIHGAPKYVGLQVRDGQADLPKNWRNFSHREVSRILQGHGWVPGQPIRLLSCRTGMNPDGFAQNLSNRLGVAVYAPTEILWIHPNGRMVVAPYGKNGKMHPTIRGTFQWFYPSGPKK